MAVNHAVTIQGGPPPTPVIGIAEGENDLPCTVPGHTDTVKLLCDFIEDGNGNTVPSFSLTDDEANDPNFGGVSFTYTG